MKRLLFSYKDSALIKQEKLAALAKDLTPEIEHIQDQLFLGYATDYASLNLPADKALYQEVAAIAAEKKACDPELVIVCGIGGSQLGTQAVVEALSGVLYHQRTKPKIYFADTVDTAAIQLLYDKAEEYLKLGKNIILNVVTKSGTTTETIANFEIFLALLKKYKPDAFHKFVVVTTDYNSPLQALARDYKFSILSIPEKVGGRYSVFSAVGQFIFMLLGFDTQELLQGAQDALQWCTNTDYQENPAALSAMIKYEQYTHNKVIINDFFAFSLQLESVGKWYRQLVGESLGKEFDREGKKVNRGITPTVSLGSNDLHSVGQLYLGGPFDKFITFVSVQEYKSPLEVPHFPEFNNLVANIQQKTLPSIMNAIVLGVKNAYKNQQRPFCSLVLPKISPYYIGQLLQLYMIEVMYLGYLLKVNCFDQPNVELYKIETRKIL